MLRFLTSGESHGRALNVIIDGFPANVEFDFEFLNNELRRRKVGYGRGGRMNIETDEAVVISGVRFGKTTGAPICVEIKNRDNANWTGTMSVLPVSGDVAEEKRITRLRPGHADFAGAVKYDQDDIRNILERSSARETAARTAVGAFAKMLLNNFGITGFSHTVRIKDVVISDKTDVSAEVAEKSDLRCCDENAYALMKNRIDEAAKAGVSLGGTVEVRFKNLPVGLGSHVQWDRRLDGLLAQAVMSIPAVKAVEIGAGIKVAELSGKDTHDEIFYENGKFYRKTNNAGGLEGGMTNGEELVVRAVMKAIPTMPTPLRSVDFVTKEETKAHFERADVCAVPACGVVAESMVAIVLANAFCEKFGCDNLAQITENYENYTKKAGSR